MPKDRTSKRPSRQPESIPNSSEWTRLHITPFDSNLLPLIIGPSDLPTARNISYHSLQAFPEKRYGYVELPAMTAEKVRKKLNGSILKGTKVRVEPARPEHDRPGVVSSPGPEGRSSQSAEPRERRSKRQKREDQIIPGVELPEGRKVQRGWTKPQDAKTKVGKTAKEGKRRSQLSSYGTAPECLFKTTLPERSASPKSPSATADSEARSAPRKAKGKSGRDTIIHEFSSTTKYASFLRDSHVPKGGKVVSEFVNDKDWVDEEGGVIETVKTRAAKTGQGSKSTSKSALKSTSSTSTKSVQIPTKGSEDNEDDQSSSAGDDSTSSSGSDETSSEASSSESEERGSLKDVKQESPEVGKLDLTKDDDDTPKAARPRALSSNSVVPGLSITIPSNEMETEGQPVHPLESLFKRPAGKPAASTAAAPSTGNGFSFFEPDGEGGGAMPQTPFTQRDFHERGQRSAAPTPDTAAPGRRFSFPWRGDEGDDSDEDEDDDGVDAKDFVRHSSKSADNGTRQSSASSMLAPPAPQEKGFEETFWEKRGETNRAWKKRRRETGKERKKRENKRLGSRLA